MCVRVCVCVCVRARVCVRACVCVRARALFFFFFFLMKRKSHIVAPGRLLLKSSVSLGTSGNVRGVRIECLSYCTRELGHEVDRNRQQLIGRFF